MELGQLNTDSKICHCPFNTAHVMLRKTFGKHLIKCPDRKPDYVNCSLNFEHVVHKSELEKHEETCSHRILLDSILYESEDNVRPVSIVENAPNILLDETWDDTKQTLNVLETINSRPVLMQAVNGLTKSERKEHRLKLHKQYADVDLSFKKN